MLNGVLVYFIFEIDKIKTVLGVGCFVALVICGFIKSFGSEFLSIDKERKVKKILIKLAIILLIILIISILLPSQETLIALTVNANAKDIYSFTTQELKSMVDYLVESINKIGG